MDKDLLLHSVAPGDLVTISTPQGQTRSGRAVMRGPHGWVLNAGGKHGTPIVATERNILKVAPVAKSRAKRVFPGYDLGGGDEAGARAFGKITAAYQEDQE